MMVSTKISKVLKYTIALSVVLHGVAFYFLSLGETNPPDNPLQEKPILVKAVIEKVEPEVMTAAPKRAAVKPPQNSKRKPAAKMQPLESFPPTRRIERRVTERAAFRPKKRMPNRVDVQQASSASIVKGHRSRHDTTVAMKIPRPVSPAAVSAVARHVTAASTRERSQGIQSMNPASFRLAGSPTRLQQVTSRNGRAPSRNTQPLVPQPMPADAIAEGDHRMAEKISPAPVRVLQIAVRVPASIGEGHGRARAATRSAGAHRSREAGQMHPATLQSPAEYSRFASLTPATAIPEPETGSAPSLFANLRSPNYLESEAPPVSTDPGEVNSPPAPKGGSAGMESVALPPVYSGDASGWTGDGNNFDLGEIRRGFSTRIWGRIAQGKFYPKAALRHGDEGEPVVGFTIGEDGKLLQLSLEKSSLIESLDEAALNTVKNASPYPRIPKPLNLKSIKFTLPISFTLEEP